MDADNEAEPNKRRNTTTAQPTEKATTRPIGEIERNEIIAAIREVFSSGAAMERAAAIPAIARPLGYQRTGEKIYAALDAALAVAVKRGVVKNESGTLSIACRTIHDYPRELLMQTLLAAMGRAWVERDEAIKLAARHLGFRRTGSAIRDAFKSVINGAIRRSLVERDSKLIRKC